MLDHDYSLADRLLHRLALGLPSVAELSFDLDQKASPAVGKADEIAQRPHVFVTGLARSGTTIMLRAIHATGAFRSLTYRDMPFPVAPNLWKRFSANRHAGGEARERAHGDRILTDADSPEALEQVFWRIETGHDYIRSDGLLPYRPESRSMVRFQRYVAAIIGSGEEGQWRYLSKNNNNVLRLPALLDSFPNARFVIPFRHPADQASSLWRQHQRFCEMQRRTPFVRSYMDWLVHHEFGLGHRPFRFDGVFPPELSPDDPDYWLETWIRVHEALSGHDDPRCLFVCYEDLCAQPGLWNALAERLALVNVDKAPAFSASEKTSSGAFDAARLARAEAIYADLRARNRV